MLNDYSSVKCHFISDFVTSKLQTKLESLHWFWDDLQRFFNIHNIWFEDIVTKPKGLKIKKNMFRMFHFGASHELKDKWIRN